MARESKIISLKNKANSAKAKGDLQDAIGCYEEILKLTPEDPNIAREIGTLYSKMGKEEKAIEYYWKAMEQYVESEYYQNATAIAQILLRAGEDKFALKQELAVLYEKQGLIGDSVVAYEEVAELYKRDGDIEGVFESFKKIVELTPKKVGIRLKLVEIYENQGKTDEAVLELEEIKDIYKEQGRVDKVDEIERKVKSLSGRGVEGKESLIFEQEGVDFGKGEAPTEVAPTEVVVENIGETLFDGIGEQETLLKEKAPKETYEGLSEPEAEEIEKSITRWDDWLNLAELYLSVGSTEDAIEYYNKAAEAQFNKKNYEEAYKIYKTISELNPDALLPRQKMVQAALKLNSRDKAVESYTYLYKCLSEKGATEEANKVLEKAMRISPNSPLIREITGRKKVKVRKTQKEEAQKVLDFDELFEEEIASEEKIEMEREKAPDLDTLLEQFKKKAAEEITVSDYSTHFDLGITYKEMDLIEEAMEEFKKAMKGEHWVLKSLEMLGNCYEKLSDFEKAEKVYRHALLSKKYDENETVAFAYYLGNLYANQGLFAKALNEYKNVVRIDSDFIDVKERIKSMSKRLRGVSIDEERTSTLVEDISVEGSNLWDSVLKKGEDNGKGEEKGKSKEKREKDRISYI
jgi:tetratricopeptide (TPR) repeat protein